MGIPPGLTTAGASPNDILTSVQQAVRGINGLSQVWKQLQGLQTSPTYGAATTTLLCTGQGILVRASIVTAGSTTGYIYDVATTGAIATANKRMALINMQGIFEAGLQFQYGLVLVTGTGQEANVTFTLAPPATNPVP